MSAPRDYNDPQAIWERGYDACAKIAWDIAKQAQDEAARAGHAQGMGWCGLIMERMEMRIVSDRRDRPIGHTDPKQDAEIKRDYYSGPSGSYTGD
jgi:hypothetical protein